MDFCVLWKSAFDRWVSCAGYNRCLLSCKLRCSILTVFEVLNLKSKFNYKVCDCALFILSILVLISYRIGIKGSGLHSPVTNLLRAPASANP